MTLGEHLKAREDSLRRALRAARTLRERDKLARRLVGVFVLYDYLGAVRKNALDKARPTQVIVARKKGTQCACAA